MSIDDHNVIDKLVKLGLNPREAKLYFALLRVPEASPAELDRVSGVPRTKIYEVLGQMVTKGFCLERQEGNKKFYRATKPSELREQLQENWRREKTGWLENRDAWEEAQRAKWESEQRAKWEKKRQTWEKERNKWEQDHQERKSVATELFYSLDGLTKTSGNAIPSLEKIETIHSKEQIILRFEKLMRDTKQELLGFTRSPYAASDDATRASQIQTQKDLLARGISIKSIYMNEPTENHWMAGYINSLLEVGEEIRVSDHLPIKMFVFDRNTVLISLPSVPGLTGADFTMIVVQDPGFVDACVILFETMWKQGDDPKEWLAKLK